ncbi:RmuC family protein [Candidatus Cyrtobacter comes]|uniref:DNA recombination protein RmuC homolog n=1 Tax=Candidatus Cyrtobacter comes TaxID=675776 RepID=A0ABU5L9B0_9RICK|nr:DNA recombination protein RmuC [Candidatus Cyrtobacter comes]MDZ5762703.1 RmuC family protein [Candidatus Cyrtobacter comes]
MQALSEINLKNNERYEKEARETIIISEKIHNLQNILQQQFQSMILSQKSQLDLMQNQLAQASHANESKMEYTKKFIQESLHQIRENNEKKLEQIRVTVEEKLQSTLEKRLGDSFQIVSERLEMVYKGLGEMKLIASSVGDLKNVLSNVKTRGIWGEVQLAAILDEILLPEQYAINVQTKPDSQDRVEFAIKLPGKDENVWLPIDSKFPLEDYQRFIDSQMQGDIDGAEYHKKLIENSLKKCAKLISDKYINPPHTTDFAIMFLPIEGMYAEVLRISGLIEVLQRDYRIVITSPTTFAAMVNSLQMGFRAIAIEKRSSEVWKVLESIKPEFVKFAELLNKTRGKLEQASKAIGDAEAKTRTIQRKLSKTEKIDMEDDDLLIE